MNRMIKKNQMNKRLKNLKTQDQPNRQMNKRLKRLKTQNQANLHLNNLDRLIPWLEHIECQYMTKEIKVIPKWSR